MYKIIIALFFMGCVAIPLCSRAEILSLQDALEQAKRHSPDLKSLNEQMESATAKKRQTLSPDNPSVSLQYNDEPSLTNTGGAGSTVVQISQPVAFPGKAFVNHDVAESQVAALEAQRKSTQLQVSFNVKQAYYQLALARKNLELQQALKEDYQEILAIAKRRYEAGSISQVDYLNTKVALYSQDNDIRDLESAEHNARVQLNTLLGSPLETPVQTEALHYAPLPVIIEEEAARKMLDNRAEIEAAKAQLTASEGSYKLARMSLLPDFQLIAGGTRYDVASASPVIAVNPNRTTYLVGVQMSIPLWAPVNQRETINSAEHDKNAAEQNLESLLEQSRNNLSSTIDALRAFSAKLKNYEDNLIPLARQSLKLALVNYSSGKIEFQELSDAANAKRNLERDYNAMIVNYLTTYSTYGQLIGEDL
jgi:outer membrane protein TolC